MNNFKRIDKRSTLVFWPKKDQTNDIDDLFSVLDNEEITGEVLQVAWLDDTHAVVEVLPFAVENETKDAPVVEDEQLNECRDTVLNRDPFGFGFSGKKLGEIERDPRGLTWLERASKEMRNEFIRQKVDYILNARR